MSDLVRERSRFTDSSSETGWGLAPADRVSLATGLAGLIIYAVFAFQIMPGPEYPPYGADIYDHYYLAILEGRLDVKAIILEYEGHYLPDGTGFLYHGMAPLLTRFLFGWLIEPTGIFYASFSVFLWSIIGTMFYHLAFHQVAKTKIEGFSKSKAGSLILSLLVWFASPGILLSSNIAFYHEAISVAYAAAAVFVFVFIRYHYFNMPVARAIIIMALMAAVTVHARPNLAVGLYIGCCLLAAVGLYRAWRAQLLPVMVAMGILGISGFTYIGINALKFGNASITHGSFEKSELQYGTTFWRGESVGNSERAKAFVAHGKFNAKRILPNLTVYAFDPPWYLVGAEISNRLGDAYNAVIKPYLGYIRIEGPRTGIVFLWLAWFAIILAGAGHSPAIIGVGDRWILLVATGTAAILTLSYGTITLRYRADLWPFVASFAIFCLPTSILKLNQLRESLIRILIIIVVGISMQASLKTAHMYSYFFREMPGTFFETWTEDNCRSMALSKLIRASRADFICSR